tara:strand:- start:125 stop:1567 length:1443 start_codon:yes stop_codon:yes gene_type:complete
MNSPELNSADIATQIEAQYAHMKKVQLREGMPSAAVRKDRLQRCIDLLVDHKDELSSALEQDFGGRSPNLTQLSEIMQGTGHYKHAIKNVEKYMKADKRSAPFPIGLLGSRAELHYQPKGVVGIMSPWNFPIAMVFVPLCNAITAGNRAIIKPSEFNPATAEMIKALIGQYFSSDEVTVFTGGAEVGAAFSTVPFDHLFFTGASSIGQKVMEAAAKNLTPVTLELGGKSPALIDAAYPIELAAERIISGKGMNSGQVCVSPDYVFVPEQELEAFIASSRETFISQFATVMGNPDYTAMINDRHYGRIVSYLDEARAAGVRIESLSEDGLTEGDRRIPIQLVINPSDDLRIMQDEIFGPLIVIKTYTNEQDCIDFINTRPSPLAFYYFGEDKKKQQRVLDNTLSGGATINNVTMHVSCYDLPFGGVGNSGMGSYHGIEGFKTFSHGRSVFRQGKLDLAKLAGTLPPYGEKVKKILAGQIKK